MGASAPRRRSARRLIGLSHDVLEDATRRPTSPLEQAVTNTRTRALHTRHRRRTTTGTKSRSSFTECRSGDVAHDQRQTQRVGVGTHVKDGAVTTYPSGSFSPRSVQRRARSTRNTRGKQRAHKAKKSTRTTEMCRRERLRVLPAGTGSLVSAAGRLAASALPCQALPGSARR